MKMFTGIFSTFYGKSKNRNDDKTNYIFYKIVDSVQENEDFLLQCINTKAIFQATLSEIVFDIDILYGLHPVQACYIGIEYAKHIKNSHMAILRSYQVEKSGRYPVCRYGEYRLLFQNREGNICFLHKLSSEEFLMDPRDIALSEELIQEFDAAQAFYIGLLAGLKINHPNQKSSAENNKQTKSHLRLVR